MQKVGIDIIRAGEVKVTFGIRESTSLRTANIRTLLGAVDFYIVPINVPFLLYLADLDRLRATYNNLKDIIF